MRLHKSVSVYHSWTGIATANRIWFIVRKVYLFFPPFCFRGCYLSPLEFSWWPIKSSLIFVYWARRCLTSFFIFLVCFKTLHVLVHLQLPAREGPTSSPCLTLKPAPTWPSPHSSTSRCASAVTLTRSSVWVQVRPPTICPFARLTCAPEKQAAVLCKLWDPINWDNSLLMDPNPVMLLNRPPSVAAAAGWAAAERCALVTHWDL